MESDLSECSAADEWSREAAQDWWRRHQAATADQTAVVEQCRLSPDEGNLAPAGNAR
jgi:hypothetical protein